MRLLPTEYAVRNLGRSRARLVMGLLGSGGVVALVLTAAGFVRGMRQGLSQAVEERNVMIVGIGSEESVQRSEIPASTGGLVAASVPGLESVLGRSVVSRQVHVDMTVRTAPPRPHPQGAASRGSSSGENEESPGAMVMVRGIDEQAMLVHPSVRIERGRFPRAGEHELMAGRMAGVRLGRPVRVGDGVWIDGEEFLVVGEFAAPGSVMEAELWTGIDVLKAVNRRETDSCVVVRLGKGPGAAQFADVDAFCKSRLDLEIAALRESDYYAGLSEFFAPVRAVAWATAGLIGLGGVLGGLNTMHAAFASRTREIGALQCIGFSRVSVLVSMIQESVLLTGAGALGACAIGVWALDGVAVRFSMGVFGLMVDAPVVALGASAGVGLGVLGALPAAWRAMRMSIPESVKAA